MSTPMTLATWVTLHSTSRHRCILLYSRSILLHWVGRRIFAFRYYTPMMGMKCYSQTAAHRHRHTVRDDGAAIDSQRGCPWRIGRIRQTACRRRLCPCEPHHRSAHLACHPLSVAPVVSLSSASAMVPRLVRPHSVPLVIGPSVPTSKGESVPRDHRAQPHTHMHHRHNNRRRRDDSHSINSEMGPYQFDRVADYPHRQRHYQCCHP